jgi:hypothetical protein
MTKPIPKASSMKTNRCIVEKKTGISDNSVMKRKSVDFQAQYYVCADRSMQNALTIPARNKHFL